MGEPIVECKIRGRIKVTGDAVLEALGFPRGVHAASVVYERERDVFDIIVESKVALPGITWWIPEGGEMPTVDMEKLSQLMAEHLPKGVE